MCYCEGATGWGLGCGRAGGASGLIVLLVRMQVSGCWCPTARPSPGDHLSLVHTPQEMLKWRRVLRDAPKRGSAQRKVLESPSRLPILDSV